MPAPTSLRSRVALLLSAGVAVFSAGVAPAAPRPVELEDLFRFHRVSDPQVSPDGRTLAYVVTDPLKAENRTNADIWVMPAAGGEAHALTNSPKHDRHPRWSPDGKWIAFESNRDGSYQIWLIPAAGGEARKLTTVSTEANGPVWSPDGSKIAFVSAVYPEFSAKPFAESDKLNKEKAAALEKNPVKARVFTQLLYRHWDSWVEGKRQHVFVLPVHDGAAAGEPRDVTPGDNDGVPTSDTFSAGDEYAFAPDGRELAYTAPSAHTREQAWVTNHDVWTVDLATGERRQLTTNLAADGCPRYSPDGKFIAYRAQARPGFEADRWQLRLHSRTSGEDFSLTEKFDSSVEAMTWAADSQSLFFSAEGPGTSALWSVDATVGEVHPLVVRGNNSELSLAADRRAMYFLKSGFAHPPEVWRHDFATKKDEQVTHANDALLSGIVMPEPESVTVAGADNTPVQMWIIKPPQFDPAKKYPLVFMVHGGPQGAWHDGWSTRWNPEVWAAQGYVLALPNPRGSTGFGQKFTDEISHDWNGKVMTDLFAALAYLEHQPWIDTTRMAAAGASYGGYVMNWFEGHTDKFKTIVCHDGTYNLDSMYGATEEVWFDEWEHGKPWAMTEEGRKASPHLYAANFKTPMLIIHNELDFRVPVTEGYQLFTALQRQGVPSKMISFPDEGHWVLKPGNSEFWHQTVFDWLAEYLKK
ncbi:MAG: S9 family peptidase [Opitutae bacterium]|nr:S9 family peptidase [Opitutae bacterium]